MDGFDLCGTKDMWILIKSIEVILSSLILSILIEGMIFKIISKFHLLHIFFVYIYFFYIVIELIFMIMDSLILLDV
jgi:hypothetical protein